MAFDYTKIPAILTWGTFDEPFPRGLKHLAEILDISYHLVDHPLFLENTPWDRIDVFREAMNVPEMYKNFNRTIIERTIYQANYFSNIKIDDTILSVSGKGIELALSSLKQYWEALNNILEQSMDEKNTNKVYIRHFGLIASGSFDAQLKFFLTTTQELITVVIKAHISNQVKKQETNRVKYEFLIKWRGDLQKQEEQFSAPSFQAIMKLITIELEVLEKLHYNSSVQSGIEDLVHNFLTSQKAQISNDSLLKLLVEENYNDFQESLRLLVMQLFSYHDITTN